MGLMWGDVKRVSVLILLLGLVLPAIPLKVESQDTLKVSVDLVNVQFSVTDRRGRLIPGLYQVYDAPGME